MTNYLKSGLAAALFAGSLAATPAIAQSDAEYVEVEVQYSDLDLSTEEGQSILNARLRRAAQYACGMDIREPGSLMPTREARGCYAEKLRSFEVQVAALVEEDAERRG